MDETLPQADFYDVESALCAAERAKLAELRRFLAARVTDASVDWWNRAEFPHELLPELGQLGLSVPSRHGYSHLFAGLVIAEMTRADASLATFFMVHHDLFVHALHEFGSAEQQDRLLADATALRTTGAFALTEPEHGSDVAGGMGTTAVRDGDGWILNGTKRWIGNGTFCDHMVLWATEPAGESAGGAAGESAGAGAAGVGRVRGFVLDATLPGVTRTRIENKTALRTVQNADIRLDNVRVSEADRFAGIDGFADTKRMLCGSRIMVGWQAVGQQLAAFDVARRYAVERHQFGRPLAKFQLIQRQLVAMLGNTVASMSMMADLARLQQEEHDGLRGRDDEAGMSRAALAKAFSTERMRETVAAGRGILGGNGIVTDYRLAKIFADAEAMYTYEGSHEINTLIVGRSITGVSAIT